MTKEKWASLGGKGQWDIIVALRGPDVVHSDTMKWFTTSVIRGAMQPVMRVGGLVNNHFQVVVLPGGNLPGLNAMQKACADLPAIYQPNLSHFLQHVEEAAQWLGIPALRMEPKAWEKAMSMGTGSAARFIVEQFPPLTDGNGLALRPEVKAIVEWMESGRPAPQDGPWGYTTAGVPPTLKSKKAKGVEVSIAAD